jgi:hypothetical protein
MQVDTARMHQAAEAYIDKWLPILGLAHWLVTVEVVSRPELLDRLAAQHAGEDEEMPEDCYGLIEWDASDESAIVYLNGDSNAPRGLEHTVIHELGHLVVNTALEADEYAGVELILNRWATSLLRVAQ